MIKNIIFKSLMLLAIVQAGFIVETQAMHRNIGQGRPVLITPNMRSKPKKSIKKSTDCKKPKKLAVVPKKIVGKPNTLQIRPVNDAKTPGRKITTSQPLITSEEDPWITIRALNLTSKSIPDSEEMPVDFEDPNVWESIRNLKLLMEGSQ